MSYRHVRAVIVSHVLMRSWMIAGSEIHARCVEGVPADATLLTFAYDVLSDSWRFVYEHPSFPAVVEGAVIPSVVMRYEAV